MTVVSSHFNENLDWMNNPKLFHYNFLVYSKTDKTKNFIEHNKGNEATAYLKYIVDNYHNLPEHLFFIHGHDMSHHQNLSITDILINFKIPVVRSFISLNRRDWYMDNMKNNATPEYNILMKEWPFPELEKPENLSYYSCAQFFTDSKNIFTNSFEFYKNLYDWFMNTSLSNFISSRLLEYTWHYILTKNPIEEKLEYKDFLNI